MSIYVKDSMSGLLWLCHSSHSNFTNFCMSGFYATFMPIQYHYPQNICIIKLMVSNIKKSENFDTVSPQIKNKLYKAK